MSLSKYHILIVDDASTVRLYHRSILEGEGFTVDEAINGIEAMEKILNKRFDLLLVDVNMPKQDGYTFLRNLRSSDVYQPPAVMISTETEEHDHMLAFEAGANYFLGKPIRPDSLIKVCKLLIGVDEAKE